MDQEIQELHMTNLLLAIQRSKNGVLTLARAAEVVGEDNIEPLRSVMDERKLLMPQSQKNKGGFELTARGLVKAVRAYVPEVAAEGGEVTQEAVWEMMQRHKEPLGPPTPWTKEEPLEVLAPEGSGVKAFLLPENSRKLFVELTQSIPHNWLWMSGELRAPQDLIVAGQASIHGGLRIDRWREEFASDQDKRESGPYARILPEEERELMITQVREDILDIMARHKLPGFIHFHEAGFDARLSDFPFRSALEVAITHLGLGYLGDLCFFSDCYDNRPVAPEEVKIHFEPWVENDMGIRTNRPPMIQILWKPGHGGGKRENVAHLIDICQSFGLQLEKVPTKFAGYGRW